MYVCICNAISDSDLKSNPELENKIGTECGECMEFFKQEFCKMENSINSTNEIESNSMKEI